MRGVSFLAVLMCASCSGSSSTPDNDGPASGTVSGEPFEVLGAYAEMRNGTAYVTMANMQASCGAFIPPSAAVLRVDISIPSTAQTPGTYAVGTSTSSPRVSATSFTDENGTLHQATVVIDSGTLDVTKFDTTVGGSLRVMAAQTTVAGTFDAPLCQ